MTDAGVSYRAETGLPLTVRAIRGAADTEIHATCHAAGPLGCDAVEALAGRLREEHGAHLLRAVVFGELSGTPPVSDDRWIRVRPTRHAGRRGTSVELWAP